FTTLRFALGPRVIDGDGCGHSLLQTPIEQTTLRIEEDLPPDRHDLERTACLFGCWRARLIQLSSDLVEVRLEDPVVHGRQPRPFGERGAGGSRPQASGHDERQCQRPATKTRKHEVESWLRPGLMRGHVKRWYAAAVSPRADRVRVQSADRGAHRRIRRWRPTSWRTC